MSAVSMSSDFLTTHLHRIINMHKFTKSNQQTVLLWSTIFTVAGEKIDVQLCHWSAVNPANEEAILAGSRPLSHGDCMNTSR